MRFNIEMQFEVNISSEENFFDSLVLGSKTLFQEEATGKFIGRILEGIDKVACDRSVSGIFELRNDATGMVRIPKWCATPKFHRYRNENKKTRDERGARPVCCEPPPVSALQGDDRSDPGGAGS